MPKVYVDCDNPTKGQKIAIAYLCKHATQDVHVEDSAVWNDDLCIHPDNEHGIVHYITKNGRIQ